MVPPLWMASAACRGMPAAMWFPERGDHQGVVSATRGAHPSAHPGRRESSDLRFVFVA
jgi:hypothetical protein